MRSKSGISAGAWSPAGAPENTIGERKRSVRRYFAILAIALFAGRAGAQVVNVPAGPPAGDLVCPHKKHSLTRKRHQRPEEFLEAPSREELAALPEQGESRPQEVVLDGNYRLDASHPLSIALWGDSHIASRYFSDEMVHALGLAPDQIQPTFIPPSMDRSGVRLPIRKHCQSDGWSYEAAYVSRQEHTAFAKGLINLKSKIPDSYLWVDFRAQAQTPNLRSLDILFVPPPRGERVLVGIIVDDGAEQIVELEQGGQGIVRIHGEQAMSTVKLRLIEGSVVLQGFVPIYLESPPVYLDTFGIPGATAHGWKALDTEYFKRDNGIPYDLVILEYGTNEGNNRNFDPVSYAAELRTSLQNVRRVYPDSLCVLIGPPDRGVLVKRRHRKKAQRASAPNVLKYSHIHQKIGNIQESVGKEFSCSYWSWQDSMGGPGSAYRWLHHSPAWMGRDLTHMTVSGYQLSARTFATDTRLATYLHSGAN